MPSKSQNKAIILATSHKTRGGITSVVNAHKRGRHWHDYKCRWIETHRDGSVVRKLLYFGTGLLKSAIYLPSANIVHIHLSEIPSAKRKLIFLKLAKSLGKKTIVHFHSFSPDTTFRSSQKGIYDKIFHMADVLIVLSPMWERLVKETFPDLTNIKVVMNPCTAEPMDKTYPKRKTILFAGALNERKGFIDMIKAFAPISKELPQWQLIFAGAGELEEKGKEIAKECGVESQVKFIGWVTGEEKDRVFKEASIFCLPSYAEGFPMSVLDAWAYGLPVITTPVGGIPDIAQDGENVLLFNPGDIAKLTECMTKMIKDDNLRQHISDASKKLSETIFSVEHINKQIAEIYSALCRQDD